MDRAPKPRDLAFAALANLVGVLLEEIHPSLSVGSRERIDQAVDVLVVALRPLGGRAGASGLRRPSRRSPDSLRRLHLPGTVGVRTWPGKGGSASSP